MIKTNNSNLALKIDLRRTVLKAGKFKTLRVLDLFAGGGEIWAALRREFKVETYLPCDLDPETPGTLQANITPLFVEAICGQSINVVDVEASGEPWEIWAAVARRLTQPAAVFLSHAPRAELSPFARAAMGIPAFWGLPDSPPELGEFSARFFLAPRFGPVTISRAWRVHLGKTVSYALLASPNSGGSNA